MYKIRDHDTKVCYLPNDHLQIELQASMVHQVLSKEVGDIAILKQHWDHAYQKTVQR